MAVHSFGEYMNISLNLSKAEQKLRQSGIIGSAIIVNNMENN